MKRIVPAKSLNEALESAESLADLLGDDAPVMPEPPRSEAPKAPAAKLSLRDMYLPCNFDCIGADMTEWNYPVKSELFTHEGVELVSMYEPIDPVGVMESRGFRPASIEQMLAYIRVHPEDPLEPWIVALGSMWDHDSRFKAAPSASGGGATGRTLGTCFLTKPWRGMWRFAAVKR